MMFGFIGNLGPWEIGLILLVVLIVFGPGKLPMLGKSLGQAINSFKQTQNHPEDEVDKKSARV